MEAMGFSGYFCSIQPGEDVIIEYSSHDPAYVLLKTLIDCLKEHDMPILIVDELDQLHVFKTHMMLAGFDTTAIDQIKVIKIGGLIQTGDVVGWIELSKELPIRKKRYEEALRKANLDFSFRIVLGFDKVLSIHEEDRRDLESLFNHMIRPYLGSRSRTTVYFINTDLITDRTLKEFREHASRVFRVRHEIDKIVLKIMKSPHISEYGEEIAVPLE
ncbi:DUF257 family protein [Thermococcus sp. 21S9]|uniref:DUF257 family protein n=1 Tax=Thermococcus sp. 21S9 TaxID=1638223 RepID=UPI00143874DA|nr:DUF257 family protein [Thermococcus sp. 21S9]NJE55478.1 hypothetical protein [Thermococcus sp. 21S9]